MSKPFGDVFRWPCSVWVESQRKWCICKLYLFKDKLAIALCKVWDVEADPDMLTIYVSVDLTALLDARLSYTWTGYKTMVLTGNPPPSDGQPSAMSWTGAGARECLANGNELWLSYLKSASSALNAIQMFRRDCLISFCRQTQAHSSASTAASQQPQQQQQQDDDSSAVQQKMIELQELAADSERTLGAAAVELDAQRESLERSHAKLKGMGEHLKVAERLLGQVTSFFPAMRSSSKHAADVHRTGAGAASTHCVLYTTEGNSRMLTGRIGLYPHASSGQATSGGGSSSKVNVVLQSSAGTVLDSDNVMLIAVDAHQANLISTGADGKQTTIALCAPRITDIFQVAIPVSSSATASTVPGSSPPAVAHGNPATTAAEGDSPLGAVSESLQRMKVMALQAGDELQGQNRLLDEMNGDVDKVSTQVVSMTKKTAVAV
eukprot:scpid78449/ scgid21941/ 